MNRIIICCIWLLCQLQASAQLKGIVKTGFNIGTINQEYWVSLEDSIKYGKPLIRPIISGGAQYWFSKSFFLQQEIMFQIKGQGTVRPDTRTASRTENPDVLRFMSFPFSINGKIIPHIFLGVSIQPSLYLSGKDNYYAMDSWKGWIWGSSVSLKFMEGAWEFGMEYDHDYTLYYCPECGVRFYTLRFYGAYHFNEE